SLQRWHSVARVQRKNQRSTSRHHARRMCARGVAFLRVTSLWPGKEKSPAPRGARKKTWMSNSGLRAGGDPYPAFGPLSEGEGKIKISRPSASADARGAPAHPATRSRSDAPRGVRG